MEDTYKNIEDFADEMGIEGLITVDGYDEAFLGIADRFGKESVAVYDYDMCIQILMRDHEMNFEEALEYFEYNTLGAFYDENQPIYIHLSEHLFKPAIKPSRNEHLVPKFSGRIKDCPSDAPKPTWEWLGL
tara:strand:- start:1672 stop:2064 length:393 start_codon:yes stop_codon:yes gene_type:complete